MSDTKNIGGSFNVRSPGSQGELGGSRIPPRILDEDLTARMEPFDSFWEAPEDIESGYDRFAKFYAHNYLPRLPDNRDTRLLVISCGAGYFVSLLASRK